MQSRDPLKKALAALRVLAEHQGCELGVRELGARLGMAPATAYRALTNLVADGLAIHVNGQGRYRLSLDAYRLGLVLAAKAPWQDICPPHLRALARTTGESPAFAVVDRTQLRMLTVARAHSEHAVQVVEQDGWKPLHAGASGLAILAHLPHADHVDALDSVRLTRETDQTITDPLLLRSELEKIRVRGYALTRGQRVPGAVGIGAPVLSTGGGVLGAVYISIPEQRFADDREPDLSRALLETTRRLGLDLSHLWANK